MSWPWLFHSIYLLIFSLHMCGFALYTRNEILKNQYDSSLTYTVWVTLNQPPFFSSINFFFKYLFGWGLLSSHPLPIMPQRSSASQSDGECNSNSHNIFLVSFFFYTSLVRGFLSLIPTPHPRTPHHHTKLIKCMSDEECNSNRPHFLFKTFI